VFMLEVGQFYRRYPTDWTFAPVFDIAEDSIFVVLRAKRMYGTTFDYTIQYVKNGLIDNVTIWDKDANMYAICEVENESIRKS